MELRNVKEHNDLIYRLPRNYNLTELKIYAILVSMLKQRESFSELIIKDSDYKNYPNLKNLVRDIKNLVEYNENDFQLFEYIRRGRGKTFFHFHDHMRKYLLDLRRDYVTYNLENVLYAESKYEFLLYRLLRTKCCNFKWKNLIEVKLEFDDLRRWIGAPNKTYDCVGEFNLRVISPSIKNINKNTDIIVELVREREYKDKILTFIVQKAGE